MPFNARTYYLDILHAMDDIEAFLQESSFAEYQENKQLIYAVERALSIIGEAVTQLHNADENIELRHAREIRGFRNILIHSYARVNQAVIWVIIKDYFPLLKKDIQQLLQQAES